MYVLLKYIYSLKTDFFTLAEKCLNTERNNLDFTYTITLIKQNFFLFLTVA